MNNNSQTQVSLKLIIDKRGKKILYGEADKTFVDFLFTILALPVGTVIRLLTKEPLLSPLSNLYGSVNALDVSYFEANKNKDKLLKPTSSVTKAQVQNLLQIESPLAKTYYYCSYSNNCVRKYFTATQGTICPGCKNGMYGCAEYVYGANEEKLNDVRGYVKEKVTYMVMDDLTVKPMSSIATVSVFNASKIDVAHVEEKLIYLGMTEGLKLLRASLHSSNVLTDVFFHKIDFTVQCVSDEKVEEDELDQIGVGGVVAIGDVAEVGFLSDGLMLEEFGYW